MSVSGHTTLKTLIRGHLNVQESDPTQGAHGQGKTGKMAKKIPYREKSGNLKILFNIRENTGNLKISKNIRENTGNFIFPRINCIENVVVRA